jgi:hypothetical protein
MNGCLKFRALVPALAAVAVSAVSAYAQGLAVTGCGAPVCIWDAAGKTHTVGNGADVTIAGKGKEAGERIVVARDAAATIRLKDVSIAGLPDNQSPLLLNSGAKVTLILEGANSLTAGSFRAGIEAPAGASLVIRGDGSLTAIGGNLGAGIGGGNLSSGGTIKIEDGTVNAYGGNLGAGIGGGDMRGGGSITITGGTVRAHGGHNGAGIGGGSGAGIAKGSAAGANSITITGGKVTAVQGGNAGAAGIGVGSGGNGETFAIGGNSIVYATSADPEPTAKAESGGILFTGKEPDCNANGKVYGSVTLKENLDLAGKTLNVPQNSSLTIPDKATLALGGGQISGQGAVTVAKGGAVDAKGGGAVAKRIRNDALFTHSKPLYATYSPNLKLASVTPPAGYEWNGGDAGLQADRKEGGQTFDATYNSKDGLFTAKGSLTVIVAKADQDPLEIANPGAKTYGDPAFKLSTTGGGGTGAVTYELVSGPKGSVAPGGSVTLSGVEWVTVRASKAGDANYNPSLPSRDMTITVSPKPVTIAGISAANKIYNGTKTATAVGSGTVSGVIGKDIVRVVPGTAEFDDENVGAGKTVIFRGFGIDGPDKAKYTLLPGQPANATASITPRPVTIANVSAASRAYDGTSAVALKGGVLRNTVSAANGEALGFALDGAAANANAGDGKPVTAKIKLTGYGAGNYALEQPEKITVSIKKASKESFETHGGTLPQSAQALKTGVANEISVPLSELTPVPGGGKSLGAQVGFQVPKTSAGGYVKTIEIKGNALKITTAAIKANAREPQVIPITVTTQNYQDLTVTVILTPTPDRAMNKSPPAD